MLTGKFIICQVPLVCPSTFTKVSFPAFFIFAFTESFGLKLVEFFKWFYLHVLRCLAYSFFCAWIMFLKIDQNILSHFVLETYPFLGLLSWKRYLFFFSKSVLSKIQTYVLVVLEVRSPTYYINNMLVGVFWLSQCMISPFNDKYEESNNTSPCCSVTLATKVTFVEIKLNHWSAVIFTNFLHTHIHVIILVSKHKM